MKKNEMAIVMRKKRVRGIGDEWKLGWTFRIQKTGRLPETKARIYYVVKIVDVEIVIEDTTGIDCEVYRVKDCRAVPIVKILETNAYWIPTKYPVHLDDTLMGDSDKIERIGGK